VNEYVRNQRERHGRGKIVDRLERITALETGADASAAGEDEAAQAERREAP
jgi:hypothetical protein